MALISRSGLAEKYDRVRQQYGRDTFKTILDSADFPKPVRVSTSRAGKQIRFYNVAEVDKYFEKYPPRRMNYVRKDRRKKSDDEDFGIGGKEAFKNPALPLTMEFYRLISGRRKPTLLQQSQNFMRSIAR